MLKTAIKHVRKLSLTFQRVCWLISQSHEKSIWTKPLWDITFLTKTITGWSTLLKYFSKIHSFWKDFLGRHSFFRCRGEDNFSFLESWELHCNKLFLLFLTQIQSTAKGGDQNLQVQEIGCYSLINIKDNTNTNTKPINTGKTQHCLFPWEFF